MNTETGLFWLQEALTAMVVLAGPILAGALIIGLVVALFQAVTTIQEMTLAYVPKMLVVVVMFFSCLDSCLNILSISWNVYLLL